MCRFCNVKLFLLPTFVYKYIVFVHSSESHYGFVENQWGVHESRIHSTTHPIHITLTFFSNQKKERKITNYLRKCLSYFLKSTRMRFPFEFVDQKMLQFWLCAAEFNILFSRSKTRKRQFSLDRAHRKKSSILSPS